MNRWGLRGSLLATTSALALITGVETSRAACTAVANPATPYSQAGNTCVTFTGVNRTGSITNSGSVTTGTGIPTASAISITGGSSINGGVTNTGSVTLGGPNEAGISVAPASFGAPGSTVTGSIVNSAGATITGGGTDIGISVNAGPVGGIVNNGTITMTGAASADIDVNNGTVNGNIVNTSTLNAGGTGAIQIINTGVVNGSVINSGTINLSNPNGAGIYVFPNPTGGTVHSVAGETITGSIVNTGTIAGGYGIKMIATANTDPVVIGGNVSNGGTITAAITGIEVGSSTVTGAVTNSGTITAGRNGILLINLAKLTSATTGFTFTGGQGNIKGGVVNSGSITSTGTGFAGIAVVGANLSGGITNTAGGTISATNGVGILLTNTGKVLFSGGTTLTNTTGPASVAGGIVNQGTISAKTGIAVLAGSVVAGGISNIGTISASGIGILLTTAAISVFDSGTIIGGGTAIQFGPGTNTLTVTPGFAITGNVLGAGSDVFQLGGTGTGTFNLNMIGTQYTGFTTVNVASATWIATGAAANNWSIANGATFQLGNGTTTGAVTGNIVDNGTLALDNPAGSTVAFSTITGSGAVAQIGPGTTVLSGANSYSGGTTISAGALQVTNNSSVGTGSVTLNGGVFQSGGAGLTFGNSFAINTAGGTVDTQANTLTLSGKVANGNGTTGALTKIGTGTLILSGSSSYTGPTNVNAGTLQAGAANSLAPASAFAVATGGTLSLNNFNETIGSLSGAGSLVLGSGTLTLADASGLFSGTITGSTNLTLQTGSETLTGNDSGFTGTFLISGGNLIVGTATSPGAILGGSVTVQPGGSLSGHGTILGSINNQGGTVSPGGSIGTLSVGGNYVQSANGTLSIQVTPAAASLLAVSGSASLAGTLQAVPSAGLYPAQSTYRILTAGAGVTGTFSQFVNTLPALNLSVSYKPNEVDLVIGGFAGQTRNQIAVANTLNQQFGGATGDFATVLTAVAALQPAQLPQTLASLGGQIYANLGEVSLQDRRLFLGAMDERIRLLGGGGSPGAAVLGGLAPGGWGNSANALQMAALGNAIGDPQVAQAGGTAPGTPALPNNMWARGFGQFGSIGSNGGALGADYSTGGGAIGAELIRTPQSLFGIAASGGQSSVSTKSLPENGTVSFVQFGIYGAQAYDYGLAADGALVYAHDFYDVSRGIVLPGLSRTATSSHGGDDAALDVGLSRPMQYDAWQITPRVGLSYFHIGQSSFAETGSASSLDLAVSPNAIDALRSRLGVTVSQPMMLGETQIQPELRAAWTHDFLDDRGAIAATFAGAPGASFQQIGATTGRDTADLGAGLSFAITQTGVPGQLSAFVEYDATLAAHQTNNAIAAGLKLTW